MEDKEDRLKKKIFKKGEENDFSEKQKFKMMLDFFGL